MLPEGWTRSTVGEACAIKNNLRLPLNVEQRSDMRGPYPYFGPTGVLDYIDHFRIDEEFAVIGEDGDHFLKYRDKPMTLYFSGKANVNNHAHVICASERCLPKWFYYWFMHRDLTPALSRQGVGRYKLTKKALCEMEIWLPPLAEQRRITEALSTWDEAISRSEQLVSASKKRNRSLATALLLGRRRLQAGASSWNYLDFDEVFERVARKNTVGNGNVLTISGEYGLIGQRQFFNKSVASADLTGYTLLHRGEFAYNKSYSSGYPMGAIKPLLAYDAGVVSSLYLCFRLRPNVDASFDFFRHYFESGMLNEGIGGIAQEGARNHGLLNVSIGDFFKLRLHVPDADEQRAIANIINAAEEEEQLHLKRLSVLRAEKQALMQQLLTGKRRVRLQSAESTP